MLEYSHNQHRWLADFVKVFDKMMTNGYTELSLGEDQSADIGCSCQAENNTLEQILFSKFKSKILIYFLTLNWSVGESCDRAVTIVSAGRRELCLTSSSSSRASWTGG